jgi:hypothetical protein
MLEQRKGVLVDFEKLQLLVLEGRQYRDDFLIFVYTIQPHASFLCYRYQHHKGHQDDKLEECILQRHTAIL